MRYLLNAAIMAAAVLVAAPSAAQVSSPGPVYYNQSGAPIPGAPQVSGPGPVYYNQSGAPIPGAPYASPNPPSYNGPQVQTGGPVYAPGPQQFAAHPGGNGAGNGRVWQNGRWVSMPASGPGHGAGNGNGNRWGGQVDGRWWGGSQAPGGWGGYRRPRRGGSLDHYWMQPGFQIPDYLSFGLSAPPYGYFWVRYYDDAVLIDSRGSVHHSVSGIAWSDSSAYAGHGYASSSASASASAGGYGRQGGQIGTIDPNSAYDAGPQGGYAPPVAYGPPAGQNSYYQQGCASACPPQYYGQGGGYQQGGYQQGGYYQGGGYYAGGSTTTTVVIQSPPVITTTIIEEEIVTEEVVTTSYAAPRRVVRRAAPPRKYRPRPRPAKRQCGCQCVCR